MDSEPVAVSNQSPDGERSLRASCQGDMTETEQDDPYSLSVPSNRLLGLTIAIASVGFPLLAVLIERPLEVETIVPTALENNGPKPSPPISLSRPGKPGS